jgi:D-3-phosphoglycerate dehydrogenase
MAYKIIIADYYYANVLQEIEILGRLENVEIIDLTRYKEGGIIEPDELIPFIVDADAVIVQFAKLTEKVINSMKKCKIIARYAIGVDNIDIKAAKANGIVVSNVPDYCIEEVSDTAITHIMNCVRALTESNFLIHENRWKYDSIKPLKRFSESTVGLIAFGNIGRRTAEKLRPFGCKILAFDPVFEDFQKYEWVSSVSYDELLSNSDVISIHAPLNEETLHMLDDEAFSKMKDGVSIVNTSRGGLIDENALIRYLEKGRVRRASLDVLDCFDSSYNVSPLLKYPGKVTITPHLGWYSETSIAELQRKVAENIYGFFMTGQPRYKVV